MTDNKYIIARSGVEISEDYLRELFDMTYFVIDGKKDYESWKNEKIENGLLRRINND